jgi:hypothetical protein
MKGRISRRPFVTWTGAAAAAAMAPTGALAQSASEQGSAPLLTFDLRYVYQYDLHDPACGPRVRAMFFAEELI